MARAIENRAIQNALNFIGDEYHERSIRRDDIVRNLGALDAFLSRGNRDNRHRYGRMAAINSEPTLPEKLIEEFAKITLHLMSRNQSGNEGEAVALAHIMTADFVFGDSDRYKDLCNGGIINNCMPKPEAINGALVNLIRGGRAVADRRDFTGVLILQALLEQPLALDIPEHARQQHYS